MTPPPASTKVLDFLCRHRYRLLGALALLTVADVAWAALSYLGLVASVGGFIVYFFLLKRLSPIVLSFVFIIFPVFAVVIGAWYEGLPLSSDLLVYSALLLMGFAITKLKLPVEKSLCVRD